ncbi:MAG: hypothetical protein IKW32_00655 [Bacteroidaceae bacterium]|nr:hypothetical protein [Bacteroidaceae bacterium]
MKKVMFIIGVCIFGTFVYWKSAKLNSTVDDLLLKNIEALADMEVSEPFYCRLSGDLTCPDNGKKVGAVYQGYSLR